MHQFCDDVGISLGGLADGAAEEIVKLASLSSNDPAPLLRDSLSRQASSRFLYCGQSLSAVDLKLARVRVCIKCMADDIDTKPDVVIWARPYRRTTWTLSGVHVCPLHQIELMEIAPGYGRHSMDFAAIVNPVIPRLVKLKGASVHSPPTNYERYLLGRVAGRSAQVPWLDQMPFHVASEICGVLGALRQVGGEAVLDDADLIRRRDVTADGFEVVENGSLAMQNLIGDMAPEVCGPKRWRGRGRFGALYDWVILLVGDVSYEPVRNLLRECACRSMGFSKQDDIFAADFRIGRLHRACR